MPDPPAASSLGRVHPAPAREAYMADPGPDLDQEAVVVGLDLAAYRSDLWELFADHLLDLSQLLLHNTSHFFNAAFRFKIGIVSQFAFSLFRRPFCIVKIAFDLLPCTVCHGFPRTCLPL